MTLYPDQLPFPDFYQYLIGSVAPRPICFASTVDGEGRANLSPFSFFNVFSGKPPVLVFSTSRRSRDNTTKDTLQNIEATGEVVINVVSYTMVQQMNISSCEYPKGTDEFVKSGFTKLASEKVKPWRVAESPAQMECKLLQIIPTGNEGGAGILIICEVVALHLSDAVLNDQQKIDPQKIDLVARMGFNWYCRASGNAVFEVERPNSKLAIGIDGLPASIRNSTLLTGNHLGMLANISEVPAVEATYEDEHLTHILHYYSLMPDELEKELHLYAKKLLDEGRISAAWQVLLVGPWPIL